VDIPFIFLPFVTSLRESFATTPVSCLAWMIFYLTSAKRICYKCLAVRCFLLCRASKACFPSPKLHHCHGVGLIDHAGGFPTLELTPIECGGYDMVCGCRGRRAVTAPCCGLLLHPVLSARPASVRAWKSVCAFCSEFQLDYPDRNPSFPEDSLLSDRPIVSQI
jgi:hypothetical protein